MLSIAISVVNGLIVAVLCNVLGGVSPAWSIIWASLAFMISHIGIALLVRRKVNAINAEMQAEMMAGQQKVNRAMHQLQMKPRGNAKTMQKLLEKEQAKSLRNALEIVDKMDAYIKWSPLLSKQINAMRMQFHFQLREFDKVDDLLDKVMYFDSTLVGMRLTRMYHNNDPQLDKFYQKKIKKFTGDKAVLLYAIYSWILVKRDEIDKAIKVLVIGKEATGNEVLKKNWEALVNGKVKKFSNGGLGELWYAMYLEEPKVQKQQQRRTRQAYR